VALSYIQFYSIAADLIMSILVDKATKLYTI